MVIDSVAVNFVPCKTNETKVEGPTVFFEQILTNKTINLIAQ